MKPGAGKVKGAEFERQTCKQLSLWISKGAREDIFWRSAMSGGRATIGLAEGKSHTSQSGDISAVDVLGFKFTERFYIECKHYKDLQLKNILYDGPSKLLTFWKDSVTTASAFRKSPILIAKENRIPTFIVLDDFGVRFFNGLSTTWQVNVPMYDASVFLFDEFLKAAPYKSLYSKLTST